MSRLNCFLCPLVLSWLAGCHTGPETALNQNASPPVAKVAPKALTEHNHARIDPYYWLKERENPEVVDYLNRENRYLSNTLAHTEKLQKELFDLRFKASAESLSNPSRIRAIRRDVARIRTLVRQRELGGAAASPAQSRK